MVRINDTVLRFPASNVLTGDFSASETFRAILYMDATHDQTLPTLELFCLVTCHIKIDLFNKDPDLVGLALQQTDESEWRRAGTFPTRKSETR